MFKTLSLFLAILSLTACVHMPKVPEWKDLAFWKFKKPVITEYYNPGDSWCYKTLASVDCYKTPQNTLPERLVGVDPRDQTPLTRREHGQALLEAARKKP